MIFASFYDALKSVINKRIMFFKSFLLILFFHSLIAENSEEYISDGSGTDFPQRCESSDDCTSMLLFCMF